MRHVREVLRLKLAAGVSAREIARRLALAPSTVRATIGRFAAAGLSWPLPEQLTDGDLEAALYPDKGSKRGHRRHVEPDWAMIHRELKRKHVTLSILWDEYIEQHPDGYRYSCFCELYRAWAGKLSVTMRQTHLGGDKLFVDYAGDTVPVIRRRWSRRSASSRNALHCRVALVGDRGKITSARIEEQLKPAGLDWITALRARAIQALAADDGPLQLSLFDDRDMAEIASPDCPGERLIVCRNPARVSKIYVLTYAFLTSLTCSKTNLDNHKVITRQFRFWQATTADIETHLI
jgi:hypothetical protein